MSLSLEKGAKLDLTKAAVDAGATSPMTKLKAAAGWDTGDIGIDLDLVAVYLDNNGNAVTAAPLTYFNKLSNNGAEHSGDNLTGAGEGDDETITFDLASIPAEASEVAVLIASYSGEKFGDVKNAFVRMVNVEGDTELAKFELKDGMADTKGVELGRIKRDGDAWTFEATGKNIAGDFADVVKSYGGTTL